MDAILTGILLTLIICWMALHKLSKPKTFHVDYCGCTAAALLLNDQIIRDAIDVIRKEKTKRDFVKTTVTVSKDGVKIIYNNEQKFSTSVPSSMIAGSTVGKSSLHDTVGVVYISPLTGQHYPAFVHVYRCDSSRTAQKFLSRLRAYMLIESHRLQIIQLEQHLLNRKLLNIDRFNAVQTQKTDTGVSSSSAASSDSRQENITNNPMKSITEELQRKIESNEPILFPPKDYDTVHANHGNIQRAQAWKSTETSSSFTTLLTTKLRSSYDMCFGSKPTIVGYTTVDPDDNRIRQHVQANSHSTTDDHKNNHVLENRIARPQLSSQKSDATVDPVETVSIAFDFLKDETDSVFTDHDGNIEPMENQQQNRPPIYRYRPPPITAMNKKLFPRNNNFELTSNVLQSNSSSRNDVNIHHNNNNHYSSQYHLQNGHKTPSETRLYHDQQRNMYLSPHYEHRLVNGSGLPITTNPLWTSTSSLIAGSQPNLLSYQNGVDSTPFHRQSNAQMNGRLPPTNLQNSLYSSYPDNRSEMLIPKQKSSIPAQQQQQQQQLNRKQKTQSQYFETNEFILCPSDGQPLRHSQYPNRHITKDYRPHSMNVNGTSLDVYY
ncbi:unnamed protein product [Adineta steineri]|uniref:PID domain-containing protein n=1 Tax=Adineta steineri TaxID=433720 RepID=A0A819DFZ9_9BILA|nr:unnamed protein product [Adineta steineri]